MKRKVLGMVLAVFVAFIVSTTCVAPVFATTYVNHLNAGAFSSVIEVPGQPKIGLICIHYDWGFAGHGDVIVVNKWLGAPPYWMTLASYTDIPSLYAFQKDILKLNPSMINLVSPSQTQVFRIGKIVMVSWTVPLVTSQVTIPPGCLLLKGYDDAYASTIGPTPVGPAGWKQTFDTTNYLASEFLVCPGWHYFGPVATNPPMIGSSPDLPNISVEGTVTFTPPI